MHLFTPSAVRNRRFGLLATSAGISFIFAAILTGTTHAAGPDEPCRALLVRRTEESAVSRVTQAQELWRRTFEELSPSQSATAIEAQALSELADELFARNPLVYRALAEELLAGFAAGHRVDWSGRFKPEWIVAELDRLGAQVRKKEPPRAFARGVIDRIDWIAESSLNDADLAAALRMRPEEAVLLKRAFLSNLAAEAPAVLEDWLFLELSSREGRKRLLDGMIQAGLPRKRLFGAYTFLSAGLSTQALTSSAPQLPATEEAPTPRQAKRSKVRDTIAAVFANIPRLLAEIDRDRPSERTSERRTRWEKTLASQVDLGNERIRSELLKFHLHSDHTALVVLGFLRSHLREFVDSTGENPEDQQERLRELLLAVFTAAAKWGDAMAEVLVEEDIPALKKAYSVELSSLLRETRLLCDREGVSIPLDPRVFMRQMKPAEIDGILRVASPLGPESAFLLEPILRWFAHAHGDAAQYLHFDGHPPIGKTAVRIRNWIRLTGKAGARNVLAILEHPGAPKNLKLWLARHAVIQPWFPENLRSLQQLHDFLDAAMSDRSLFWYDKNLIPDLLARLDIAWDSPELQSLLDELRSHPLPYNTPTVMDSRAAVRSGNAKLSPGYGLHSPPQIAERTEWLLLHDDASARKAILEGLRPGVPGMNEMAVTTLARLDVRFTREELEAFAMQAEYLSAGRLVELAREQPEFIDLLIERARFHARSGGKGRTEIRLIEVMALAAPHFDRPSADAAAETIQRQLAATERAIQLNQYHPYRDDPHQLKTVAEQALAALSRVRDAETSATALR